LGIELFERVAEARGRVLRVEQLVPAGGASSPRRGPGYLLTFDVGRILVVADPAHGCLLVRHVESAAEVEAIKRAPMDEQEPWWRVVGNPVTRVWPGGAGAGAASGAGDLHEVRLQFREDDANPRVISLRYDDGAVRVAEETTHGR
jgi:hypothetical protein